MTRVCILIGGIFSGAEGRLTGFLRFWRYLLLDPSHLKNNASAH